MVNVMFKKGLLANLPVTYSEGSFYVTTDERAIYLDVDNSTRIRIGDFQEFATLEALRANPNPSTTALYYVDDINCLAKWNGTDYIQINRDTGMTSVEVTGDGNAVTAAVYSADGRKLTLTKGATYMTADDVDEKIAAAVGELGENYENVKAYVDDKTAGIAQESELTKLSGRVTTAEGEIDALQKDTHTHANAEELAKIEGGDVAKWNAAEQNAKSYTDDTIAGLKLAETYEPIGKGAEEAGKVNSALETYKTANDAAVKAAADAAAAAQGEIDTLEEKVGAVPDNKTVVQMIGENADAIATLTGSGEGSVDRKITDAFNDFSTKVTDDAVVNSYKELIDWAAEHGSEAAEMAASITALENIVAGIGGEGEPATVIAYVSAAIDALKIGDYAKAKDLTDLAGRVSTIEGKTSAWDNAEKNAKDHADGLNTAMDTRVKVLEAINHDAYKGYADQAEADAVTTANAYTDAQIAANAMSWGSF